MINIEEYHQGHFYHELKEKEGLKLARKSWENITLMERSPKGPSASGDYLKWRADRNREHSTTEFEDSNPHQNILLEEADNRLLDSLQKANTENSQLQEQIKHEKLSALEERLRAIEGLNMYGSVDVASLRLVPDVVVPPKFKVPDFDKYTGNLDPRIHLATYIAKMSALTEDDRLLVHFFHESLSGAALRWCIQLDRSKLRSWKDLADAFLKQYKFNCDVAPTRRDLQNLVQKDRESFKEYAQRWREKAAEVHPPVTDNELCSLFIETLKAPYFNLMIGNTSNSFSDIIQAGERIEANLRMGRLQELAENPAKKTANFGKKKEGDVHSVTRQNNYSPLPQNNYRPYPPPHGQTVANIPPPFPNYPHPRPQYPPPTNYQPRPPPPPAQPRPPQNNPRPPRNPDPPLPLPLSEIYRYLVGINQIVPVPLDPIQPPYPRWYDTTARCEYHGGAQGHSTDNCEALRGRVHALIRNGWLKIEGNGSLPNVTSNPLPNHNAGSGVNMIEPGSRQAGSLL
ncbi:hypothetical protein P3X46_026179 [Hevea brasiliensis]|uniref:Retrotransposon gag domain-containing protein n=1 Tax=Hevea brasiliensis TaxID=3981 RepID=A0ABQ9KYQ4_HEVBR|nr:hypothetical protein P3X46_026179 [Hevea brasiliensis]